MSPVKGERVGAAFMSADCAQRGVWHNRLYGGGCHVSPRLLHQPIYHVLRVTGSSQWLSPVLIAEASYCLSCQPLQIAAFFWYIFRIALILQICNCAPNCAAELAFTVVAAHCSVSGRPLMSVHWLHGTPKQFLPRRSLRGGTGSGP